MKKIHYVSTSVLRADLMNALKAVEEGAEIEITRYGRTIARLSSPIPVQQKPVLRLVINTNKGATTHEH